MTTAGQESPRLLSGDAFNFELDAELRRAVRVRSHLTLVIMRASQESDAPAGVPMEAVVQQIARRVSTGVRDTDLIGCTQAGALSLVLLDTDLTHGAHVISRLISTMEGDDTLGASVRIAVGAACYPEDAIDAASLTREAMSRPMVSWRGGESASHGN